MKVKRNSSLEARRQREAYLLVAPWVLGLLLFFIGPLISSVVYAFSEVTITSGSIVTEFAGLKYFKYIINENPTYMVNFRQALSSMFISLPMIFALSLVLAVVLNQKFPGRTVFRGIFFLPVIIASSVVMQHMGTSAVGAQLTVSSGAEYNYGGIIDFTSIISNLNLPSSINDLLLQYLNQIFSMIWKCGIQTILFLSGLQSIPISLYEVSKIEGASKWEEFWYVTVPMLRNIIVLVLVFTMLDNFTSVENKIMSNAYSVMQEKQVYNEASAMLWLYFVVIMAVVGLVLYLYNRFCMKKWE